MSNLFHTHAASRRLDRTRGVHSAGGPPRKRRGPKWWREFIDTLRA